MRASQLFIPTLRSDPADADAVSHRLLLRGGFIRTVGAGLYTFMPLGWRVHQKVVQIIREEIDRIGGQELLCPVLTPAELWQQSGRYDIPEVFKLEDRVGRPFVLPMTHEETVTFHAREIQSYRELPQIWYHFQTKNRDEPRPRGGLLRLREFIMKDSYSFDRDEEGLDRSFRLHAQAYERIFERCGIEFYAVQAESGMMGGSESIDYLAPADAGENTLVTCERGDYAADLEIAHGIPRAAELPEPLNAPAEVETPGITTIDELAEPARRRPCRDLQGDARRDARRGSRPRAGAGRRPPRRGEAGSVPRRRDPACDRGRDHGRVRRRPRLPRTGGIRRDRRRRRGAAAGPVRRRRQPNRVAPPRRRARTGLRAAVRGHPGAARRGHVSPMRWQPPLPDCDRGRPHLQARYPLLGPVRRCVRRRGWSGAAARHGILRHRAGPDHDGRRRAAPRRERHRMAARRLRRTTSASSRSEPPVPRRQARPRAWSRASSARASRSCSTTATCDQARSSPMPI